MSVDVPDWIKEIKPIVKTIPLKPYSINGLLFPEAEAVWSFETTMGYPRKRLSDYSKYRPEIIVIVMDFSGITGLNPDLTRDALNFIGANLRDENDPFYMVLDAVQPWEDLTRALIKRWAIVAAGRRQGAIGYELIGDKSKINKHAEAFRKLTDKGEWVNGRDFALNTLNLQSKYKISQRLKHMHQAGLAFRASHGRSAYYHSVI